MKSTSTVFTEEVESLEWRYALKPASMAIAVYADDEREYHEIALIHVQMRQPKQAARVAEIVQRCIQYPVILVLACADEAGEAVYLSLADKRINRADASRLTVEQRLTAAGYRWRGCRRCSALLWTVCAQPASAMYIFMRFIRI